MTTKSGKGKSSGSAKPVKTAARKAPAKAPSRTHVVEEKAAKKAAHPTARPAPKPAAPKPTSPRPAAPRPPGPKAAAPKPPAPRPAVVAPAAPARLTKAARRARSKEFERYRALLLERQGELMQAYNDSKGDRRVHPDSGTEDYIDYAVSSYAKEFLLSLSEMDRKQLLLVKEALDRVERGEYGRCQQCAEEISRKRLEVAPWARYCLRCQDLEEQGLLPQNPTRIDADAGEDEEPEDLPAAELEEELETEEVGDLEEDPLGDTDEEAGEAEEE